MIFSIIQKSKLEGAHRLDAEYYQPDYLVVKEKLLSSPQLVEISRRITDFGAYSQMNFVEYTDSGARFLRNQDVGEIFIDDSEPIFLSLDTYKKLSLRLEEYDIVMPRVGTLGNAAVVLKNHLPASANQNLAQIKPDVEKIDPFYLSVFLCCRFGRAQFERFATGNVQPWLNLAQIKSLKVFLPTSVQQSSIKDTVVKAIKVYENSKFFYSQAENLLLEELGLKDFRPADELYSIVNLSEVKNAKRIDAEHFQPKYERLLQALGRNTRPLRDIAKRVSKKEKIEPKHEYNYIEISDVSVGSGEVSFNPIQGRDLPANAKIKANGGEIIVSKVRPTRGAVAIIPDTWNKDFILSGAFSVFQIPSPMREYVQVVLRSFVGKLQLERPTTGTSYPTVTDQDIEGIVVPILSGATQQKIAELVRQSHEARKKAKQLLEEAKQKVENVIEKSQTS